MSPRRLDPGIVFARPESINELLDHLEKYGSDDPAVLREDPMKRHGVERILTQLVELAAGINSHVVGANTGVAPHNHRESFRFAAENGLISKELADELGPLVGMRNLLVHEYLEIDVRKVAAAVPLALDGYRRYVTSLAAFMSSS